MLSVSEGFKNSISQLSVYSDGKIDIINSVGTLSYDKDSISKFEIFGTAFSNDKVLGNLAQHSLTLEIFSDLTKNIPLSLENRIQARIGVLVGGVYEYVQFQDFLITNVSYSDTTNVTMITATDNLLKLNVEFVDTNIYPMTLIAYATSVLTYCGLSLENTTFLNDDFVIESKPFVNGTLAKDIISRIAELALCFVQVKKTNNKVEFLDAFSPFTFGYTHGGLEGYTYDELGTFTYDELEFISYQGLSSFTHQELASYTHYDLAHFFNQSDEDITKDEYWSLKLSDYPYGRFGYNTVILRTSEVEGENVSKQEDGMVASDGNIPLTIVDNDLINTEAKRLSVINAIYDHILGYKYYPYTLEYRGFPYLELGDVVVINKIDDTPIYSPIYEMIIRYDGGLYGKLQAEALSLTQSKYLNTKPLSQRVKTAEIKVDKVEGEVTIMAGDYYNGILQGAKYVFDGDNATFYGGGLKIKNNDGDDVLYADTEGNLLLAGHIKMLQENEVVTVGTGGDFATINEALLFVQQKYPQFISGTNTVSSAEIRLKTGFIMNEQVLVERLNLGFVTITSEDAEVVINRSALIKPMNTSEFPNEYPAFGGNENAVLPVIDVLFNMNATGASDRRHGIFVSKNSSAHIRPNKGVKNCGGYGIYAEASSNVSAESTIFTNCLQNGISANNNSRINCQFADASGAGWTCIIASDCSFINAEGAIATGGIFGISAQYSSSINARNAIATGYTTYGIYAQRGSMITAIGANAGGGAVGTGIVVVLGSTISANSAIGSTNVTVNTLTGSGIVFQ